MENIGEGEKLKAKFEKWGYQDYFREYLLLLADKGAEGLESINSFPKEIELSDRWHQVLNQMRQSSQDGVERLAMVGFKHDKRRIFLPTFPVKGGKSNIPCDVIAGEMMRTRGEFGMSDLIGDLHSHPRFLYTGSLAWRIEGFLTRIEQIIDKTQRDEPAFSAGDLYRIIMGANYKAYPEFLPMMGVVHGNHNAFAFRTRETPTLGHLAAFINQTSFEKHWYDAYDFSYSGSIDKGRDIKANSRSASGWKMNLGIAKAYKLALYKGRPNKNLKRAYP